MGQPQQGEGREQGDQGRQQIMVIGPDGSPMGAANLPSNSEEDQGGLADMVSEPAKVMRIGTMVKQLLDEVRAAPLDEASRNRLREIHRRSIAELEEGLAPELRDELERLSLPFTEEETPSEGELRIAQAQLVGWLEGLFHGIQTALFAQQMSSRMQLEAMRRGLPPGAGPAQQGGGQEHVGRSPGQYL
jgi:hypothetical protein